MNITVHCRGSTKSAQQAQAAEVSFDEQKTLATQVLAIQKAPRTEDIPLLQHIDTTVDIPVCRNITMTA